jgi:hypothetical protein
MDDLNASVLRRGTVTPRNEDQWSLFFPNRPLLLSEDEEDTKRVVRSAKDKR